jgi:diguanylate cyclase (GGDEF)-like protein/PAS domain S-box-containing protein
MMDSGTPRAGGHPAWVDAEPFRALMRHSAEIIAITDPDAKVLWVSPAIEPVLGYTPEEMVGRIGFSVADPSEVAADEEPYRLPGQETLSAERVRVHHRDGSWRVLEVTFTDRCSDPDVGGYIVNATDVTGLADTEQALHTSEKAFRLFASSAAVGILFTDADARATYVNDRWLEIAGLDREQMTGRAWLRVTHPEDRRTFVDRSRANLARDDRSDFEHRVLRNDGSTVWVRGHTVVVRDTDGTVAGHVTSLEDVTAEREAREREARLSALVEHSHDLVSIYDASGNFIYASPSHERVFGYSPDELMGINPITMVDPDERTRVATAFANQLSGTQTPRGIGHRVHCKDGSWRYVESVAIDLSHDPSVGGILVNARDVTDRRHAEVVAADQAAIIERIARGEPLKATLDETAEMVERWFPGTRGVIAIVDDQSTLRVVSAPHLPVEARGAFDGYPVPAEARGIYARGAAAAPLAADDDAGRLLIDLGFRSFWIGVIHDASTDGPNLGAIVVLRRDVDDPDDTALRQLEQAATVAAIAVERNDAQAQLAHQANHDALTGLPNRKVVLERLRTLDGRRNRRGGPDTALLFLDIDRFKVLNDSVGHDAGDRLLVELGARLQAAVRPGDLVARFGGDEFVMVCDSLDGGRAAFELGRRVLDVVRQPFDVAGAELVVTASIGIAIVDERPPEEVLRDADAAMYWAKERGRARVELFDEPLRERVVARLDVERALRRAVDGGDLVLHYQPIVSLDTGMLAGFEALLRWPHPDRGLLLPEQFLGVAEECGLMRPIGAWVREHTCRQAVRWHAAHPEWGDFAMGLNLSAAELVDPLLGDRIEQTIRETGMDPTLLAFELTERLLFEDADAARGLFARLSELGVMLALDDFGTGHSPLVQLKEFPIHSLKIDREFVKGLGIDRYDDAIVDSIVGLARQLDLFSVAEGVETLDQQKRLRASGCLLAQGHLYAPALAPEEVERTLSDGVGPIQFSLDD